MAELRGEHRPETEVFGITSFVYRARRPFHPQRFWDLLQQEWPGVIRSKGCFWLATRPHLSGSWSQAGAAARHGPGAAWWAAVPREEWPAAEDTETLAHIAEAWEEPHGDRRQELVLIGIGMDHARIRGLLDACLLDDAQWRAGPAAWQRLPDPFPAWEASATDGD
jgi:G3E family GTPase